MMIPNSTTFEDKADVIFKHVCMCLNTEPLNERVSQVENCLYVSKLVWHIRGNGSTCGG